MLSNKIVKFCVYLVVFLIFILNASGNIESIDGLASLNMARNFVYHGTWNVATPEFNVGMGVFKVGDLYYSGASKGYAIAMIPAVYLSKLIYEKSGFIPVKNFPLESDYLLTLMASFINPILGFVLFVVLVQILLLIVENERLSILLSGVMSFSTNLLPLAKHSFAHILFTVLVSIALYCILRILKKPNDFKWILLLMIDFVLFMFCYNNSFVLPVVGLYVFVILYLLSNIKSQKKAMFFLFILFVSIVLGVIGSFITGINLSNLKSFFVGEGTRKDFFQALWGQLFSPGRSVFVYSPILILAVYWSFRNFKNIYSKLFLLMLGLYVGFYSLFDIWHGELSYGPRYLAVLIPFGIIVLAINWKEVNKIVFGTLVFLGLYVQLVGVVIPYGVQYPEFDMLNISSENIKNRQDKFDYWSLGEFIPRFSPPYRLKRVLVTRLLSFKDIFKNTNSDAILASNVMLPDKNSPGRGVEGVFYIKVLVDIDFSSIDIVVDKKYKNLILCDKNGCQKNKYNFSLKKGDLLKFDFGTNEKYYITKLVLGENSVNLTDYRLVNTDRYLNRDNMLGEEKNIADLKTDWWYTGMVNNLTPDFWWVKVKVYENLFN